MHVLQEPIAILIKDSSNPRANIIPNDEPVKVSSTITCTYAVQKEKEVYYTLRERKKL